jgi:hypothetical protein
VRVERHGLGHRTTVRSVPRATRERARSRPCLKASSSAKLLSRYSARVSENRPIEKCDVVALGYRGRAVIDDLAVLRGKQDLHVHKSDRQLLRLEGPRSKQLVKVSRGYYLWAVGTAREQMFQDSSEDTPTVWYSNSSPRKSTAKMSQLLRQDRSPER